MSIPKEGIEAWVSRKAPIICLLHTYDEVRDDESNYQKVRVIPVEEEKMEEKRKVFEGEMWVSRNLNFDKFGFGITLFSSQDKKALHDRKVKVTIEELKPAITVEEFKVALVKKYGTHCLRPDLDGWQILLNWSNEKNKWEYLGNHYPTLEALAEGEREKVGL